MTGISAMKKHIYRTKKINAIDWIQMKEQLQGSPVVFAIDVAKKNNTPYWPMRIPVFLNC